MLTYILGTLAIIALTPTFLVAGLLVLHLMNEFCASLTEEPMDEKPKQYRKHLYLNPSPPALIRIKELGWRQGCGHTMHQWDGDRSVCLQCILEGRVAAKDGGRMQ
jgi:hypothetical protein